MLTDSGESAKFCPKCGGDLAPEAVFCHHCAYKLPSETQAEIPVARTNKLPLILIWVVGIVIVLTVAGILTYQYRLKNAASSSNNVMSQRALNLEEKIIHGESLSESDISGLTAHELRVLRNVHFARYGRGYDRPGLGDYFSSRPWYRPDPSYQDSMINATDKANINLILAEEARVRATEAASNTAPNASSTSSLTELLSKGIAGKETLPSGVIDNAVGATALEVLRTQMMLSEWRLERILSTSVQVLRQGEYKEDGKYWPVKATVNGTGYIVSRFSATGASPPRNAAFSFTADFKIKKNDYGDWVAVPPSNPREVNVNYFR